MQVIQLSSGVSYENTRISKEHKTSTLSRLPLRRNAKSIRAYAGQGNSQVKEFAAGVAILLLAVALFWLLAAIPYVFA